MLNVLIEAFVIATVVNAIVFQVMKAKVVKELHVQMIALVTDVAHIFKIFLTRLFHKTTFTVILKRSYPRHSSTTSGMERKPEAVFVMLNMVM